MAEVRLVKVANELGVGTHTVIDLLKSKGFDQVRIDGRVYDLAEDLLLIKTNRHNIDVIVDKIALNKKQITDKEINQRIKDDVEIALELADGLTSLSLVHDKSFFALMIQRYDFF